MTRSEQRRINVQQGRPVNEGLEPTMTDRDRLIELLDEAKDKFNNLLFEKELIADHLLANGVIVPPCNVGDTVHCLYQDCQKETKIIELEIDVFEIHKDYVIINGYKGEYCYRYFTREVGKTVFLTKEEAEQVLRKEDEGK